MAQKRRAGKCRPRDGDHRDDGQSHDCGANRCTSRAFRNSFHLDLLQVSAAPCDAVPCSLKKTDPIALC
jgi:hypothetical protein